MGRFDNRLLSSVIEISLSLSSKTEDIGEEQSTFVVSVIDLLVDMHDELTGALPIDRAGCEGEHEADLPLAWAMIRSREEAYSSRSRRNDALRS